MIGRALGQGIREARSTLAQPSEFLLEALGATRSIAGPRVDEQSALAHAAVKACVRAVSEDVGKVPCIVYERTGARSRERAPYDAYAPALALSPNPEMTAMEYWENLTAYGMLWGKGDAYINRRRNGTIELWPLPPNRTQRVRAKLESGAPGKYAPGPIIGLNITLDTGEVRFLPWRNVVSMGAFGYDPLTPIARARETIGLGLAGEHYGSRFFGQGGHAGGFISMPVEATPEQADRTEAAYRAKHEGLDRAHLTGILQGGASWVDVGMPLKDAQFIEGRHFGIEEACRVFRVPPHKVQHLVRSTFSNIENQSIEYVTDTVSSWTTRHEQTHRLALFGTRTYGQEGDRYPEFLLEGLLRGDIETRYKAYALAVNWGWMSRSDVRERENMSHEPDLDDFLVPLNMSIAGQEIAPEDEPVRKLAALLARSYHADTNGHGLSAPAPTLPAQVTS